MTSWKLLLFLWIHLLPLISSDYKDAESQCAAQQTCTSCLRTPQCVWCSNTEANQDPASVFMRCITRAKYHKELDDWCPESHVVNDPNYLSILENRPLSAAKGSVPVQIQPQRVQLRLRRGEEYRLTLNYSLAEDYPVDLYYIMDLSYTMKTYKKQLSQIGLDIAEAMRKLTSNFRLGFGSFVDKVVLPMTNPKHVLRETDDYPYGYRNQMPLTDDIYSFKEKVQRAVISGNLDPPEGGMDAIMQAIVCTKEIGWRRQARHLIVLSTDATSHIAGDGRLAGIIEPNDCKCHLDEHGNYTYSLLQDYPSIAQINRMAREHNVNIIFAITSKVFDSYKSLSSRISGSSIDIIHQNSNNLVKIISSEYEKLVQTVSLTDNAPEVIDLKYFSRCLDRHKELQERHECGGLRVGDIVSFELSFKAVDCPAKPSEWQQSIYIRPGGINESLRIDLTIVCDCPCAQPGHSGYVPASPGCEGNGTMICGVCDCNDGFYGKTCECGGDEIDMNSEAYLFKCKPNNETTKICSGNGVCKCGVCDCTKKPDPNQFFYGTYCECDNFYCNRSRGMICGGRGKCKCGVCNCDAGWGGEACNCWQSNSTCYPPGTEMAEMCSGRGDCVCGKCHCQEKDNIRYSGKYCEECPTCPGQLCEELKNCVECKAYNSGPYVEDNLCDTCPHEIEIVDVVEEDSVQDLVTSSTVCRTPGDAGCTFIFKYHEHRQASGGDIKVFDIIAQRKRQCPEPLNVFGVAVGLVVGTVFLGLVILLIWRVVTTIYDKREFAKFERERALAKWSREDNPLYRLATSTFTNPAYHGGQ